MSDFLQTMAALSAQRAATAESQTRRASADKAVVPLRLGSFDLIAEIKDRSPSAGDLTLANSDRRQQAVHYVAGGAAAISVLTEPSRFSGALEHLAEVAGAVPDTPVMRKDFLVEPVQITEARNAGASGVLLIATMLSDAKLDDMLRCSYEHDMFVLLESFDRNDLTRTTKLLEQSVHQDKAEDGQLLVGINTRNLRTLEVDQNRLGELSSALPAARCVAESGLRCADDVAAVAALGYRLALVGTVLMRSDDPAALVAEMCSAGRARIAA